MKRRGFLAGLLGLPFVGLAAQRSLSNDELKRIAEKHPPAAEWLHGSVTLGTFNSNVSVTMSAARSS